MSGEAFKQSIISSCQIVFNSTHLIRFDDTTTLHYTWCTVHAYRESSKQLSHTKSGLAQLEHPTFHPVCALTEELESSWNLMAHGDAREGKWRRNWRIEWVASTLHTTSEHGVSSITTITTADSHTSAASSPLNWRPCRFKWTRQFRRKTKSGFCACAITFQTQSTEYDEWTAGLLPTSGEWWACIILPHITNTHKHTRARARAHTHTHTYIYIYILFN